MEKIKSMINSNAASSAVSNNMCIYFETLGGYLLCFCINKILFYLIICVPMCDLYENIEISLNFPLILSPSSRNPHERNEEPQ